MFIMRLASARGFSLFMQQVPCAPSLAPDRAGRSKAARIAMMAMTTRSSIKMKDPGARQ